MDYEANTSTKFFRNVYIIVVHIYNWYVFGVIYMGKDYSLEIKPYLSTKDYIKNENDSNTDYNQLCDSIGTINIDNNRIALNLQGIATDIDSGEILPDDGIIMGIAYVTAHEFLHYLFYDIDDFDGICPCCRENIEESIIADMLDWWISEYCDY